MQGPHDFYVQTKLKAVILQAEVAQPLGEPEDKPTLWMRVRALFTFAILRPASRRA